MTDGAPNIGERCGGPRFGVLNWLIFVGCTGLPWMMRGWHGPLTGLGLLGLWIVLVRPTWRGLAPLYLTALLVLNLVLLAVLAVWDV